jgi:hypothetical protein
MRCESRRSPRCPWPSCRGWRRPAGAAVPKAKPTFVVERGHGSKKATDVWAPPSHFAETTPCKRWLGYSWHATPGAIIYYLPPGGPFNW